jgi:hypothetical protein
MSDFSSSSSNTNNGLFMEQDLQGIRLVSKPHGFAGAVLTPRHARDLTPNLVLQMATALAEQTTTTIITVAMMTGDSATVSYTVWITEAWRVLGWAEPSAALFWELATMYHALQVAGRSGESRIPPILSCGSTASIGSGATSSVNTGGGDLAGTRGGGGGKKFSSVASAKELPVCLIATFLLLHCEEFAYLRNLSGQDERRFGSLAASAIADPHMMAGGKMDFTTLFKNSTLSPR